jgi:hypothetical protein
MRDHTGIGFHKRYLLISALVFLLEVCIGVFVHDRFVRPFVGDVLVVVLIYSLVRVFCESSPAKVAVGVFAFACLVELGQYLDLVSVLGLQDSLVARIIIGATFDWKDILAYALGAALVIVGDRDRAGESPPAAEQG